MSSVKDSVTAGVSAPRTVFRTENAFGLLAAALDIGRRSMLAQTGAASLGLRGSHLRVLSLIPRDGMRPTALASRVGMTKQSLGEFVAALEGAGYVEVSVDPTDRRARVVAPTSAGEKAQDQINRGFADIEERWRAEVGPRRWSTFIKVLQHLHREQERL
jgi:DNA-binding MarR family transcriptional regulator